MKLSSRKGQMGLLGEDMIIILVVAVSIAIVLAVSVKSFYDHGQKYAMINTYRLGLVMAEKKAVDLSWETGGVKRNRVLDQKKLTEALDCSGVDGLCITDKLTKEVYECPKGACSNPTLEAKVIVDLPVSIRISEKEYHPGSLQVSYKQA